MRVPAASTDEESCCNVHVHTCSKRGHARVWIITLIIIGNRPGGERLTHTCPAQLTMLLVLERYSSYCHSTTLRIGLIYSITIISHNIRLEHDLVHTKWTALHPVRLLASVQHVRNVDSNARHFTFQDNRLPFNTIVPPRFSIRSTQHSCRNQ